jgi:hypothetical protein
MDRKLDLDSEDDLSVEMNWLVDSTEVIIQVVDRNHNIEWSKNIIGDGKLALEVFYHPHFYGFGLDR